MGMGKVKFVLTSTEQKINKTFASLEISPLGEDLYCHLELGNTPWAELRRLISLNYWMEWDHSDTKSPSLRLSKKAFADSATIPRNDQQSKFGQCLPGILQKDAAGWRVVAYAQTDKYLSITFAHASQTAGNEDDLIQMQIDFTSHYTCSANFISKKQ